MRNSLEKGSCFVHDSVCFAHSAGGHTEIEALISFRMNAYSVPAQRCYSFSATPNPSVRVGPNGAFLGALLSAKMLRPPVERIVIPVLPTIGWILIVIGVVVLILGLIPQLGLASRGPYGWGGGLLLIIVGVVLLFIPV